MAIVVKDRVKVTTSTTGTGTLTLGSAESGFQAFSVIGDGNQTYYAIKSDAGFEVGIGTYTHSGTTLSRDTILESSNSGSAVSLTGTSTVFTTYPAERSSFRNVGVARDYTASGSITAGKPLILNNDNTVTQVGASTITAGLGTLDTTTLSDSGYHQVAYGKENEFINIYRLENTNNNVYATPNTISSADLTTITKGTTGSVDFGYMRDAGIIYEPNEDKYVIISMNSSNYLTGAVVTYNGTGSGATVTIGTPTVLDSSGTYQHGTSNQNLAYDTTAQKIVVSYCHASSNAITIVVNLSGTTLTAGSRTTVPIYGTYINDGSVKVAYSSTANRVIYLYADNNNNKYYTTVGTVSGTSISFGSTQEVTNQVTGYTNNGGNGSIAVADTGEVVLTYLNSSYELFSQAGTLSNTTITWGSPSQISNIICYNGSGSGGDQYSGQEPIASGKIIVARSTTSSSPSNASKGIFCVVSVSGTSVTNGSVQQFSTVSETTRYLQVSTNVSKTQAVFTSGNAEIDNIVFLESNQSGASNLTTDNYFGIASSSASDTEAVGVNRPGSINIDQTGLTAGKDYYAKDDGTIIERTTTATTPDTFATATIESLTTVNPSASQKIDIIYDTHNDKVWAYSKDSDNSNYPTVVVGDISSGTSITWGTPVTVTSNSYAPTSTQSQRNLASDGAGNILVAYRDTSNDYARVKVGNYSGTNSATFGNELQPDNISALQTIDIGYCSSANLWYMFHGNSTSTKWVLMKQNSGNQNFDSSDVGTLHTGNATGINNVYTTNNKIIVGLDATGDGKFYVCNTSADGSTNTGYTLNIGTVQNITITNNSSADGRLKIITDTTNNNYILIDSTGSTGMNCSVITESSGSLTQSTPQGVASSSGTMAGNTAFYNPSDQKFYGAYQVHTSPYACKNYLLTVSGTTFTFVDGVDMPNADDRGLWTQGIYIADITKGVFVGQTNNGYDLLTAIMNINSTTSTTINASQFVGTARSSTDLELAEPPTELVGLANGSITKGNAVVLRSDGDFEKISSTGVAVVKPQTQQVSTQVNENDQFRVANNGSGTIAVVTTASSEASIILGTDDGTSITWGSPVTMSSNAMVGATVYYDSYEDKFIATYSNTSNNVYSRIVSYSGTTATLSTESSSMSTSSAIYNPTSSYDSTNNKGYVCLGSPLSKMFTVTVSGTTITQSSLSSQATASGNDIRNYNMIYDNTNNVGYITYKNYSVANYPYFLAFTVSGNTFTFGTETVVESTSASKNVGVAEGSVDGNGICVAYKTTANIRFADVSVTGTTPTIGTVSSVTSTPTQADIYWEGSQCVNYNSGSKSFILAYQDTGGGKYDIITNNGTVSDGNITFDTYDIVFPSTTASQYYAVSTPTGVNSNNAFIIQTRYSGNRTAGSIYGAGSSSTNLTATNFIGFAQQTVADNEDVKVATIGQTDDNQSSLTLATQFYVQNDGTLSTTAGTPSVLGGTALSSTKILIKS